MHISFSISFPCQGMKNLFHIFQTHNKCSIYLKINKLYDIPLRSDKNSFEKVTKEKVLIIAYTAAIHHMLDGQKYWWNKQLKNMNQIQLMTHVTTLLYLLLIINPQGTKYGAIPIVTHFLFIYHDNDPWDCHREIYIVYEFLFIRI